MKKLIVANWKMQKTHSQAISWCEDYFPELHAVLCARSIKLVLCPSFTELGELNSFISSLGMEQNILLGAQDCADHEMGAYTGDVSVLSLAQIGCRYCIVGHSERRRLHHESSAQVSIKAHLCLKNNILPIICVGETLEQRADNLTVQVLQEQLKPILDNLPSNPNFFYIAYEPLWAIGTGAIPGPEFLIEALVSIKEYVRKKYNENQFGILYGGGIDDSTILSLKSLNHVQGFLLGSSSLDFEKLKNIIISLG